MPDQAGGGQSGGVNNSGTMSAGGDIVGRDKIVGVPSPAELASALQPLREMVRTAPADTKAEAATKLDALEQEAVKGEKADDDTVADLIDGLVELLPSAASAVVTTFATPVLGGIVGPATKFVLRKLRSK